MKNKYTVQRAIKRDGKINQAGSPLWLSAAEAARLVAIGALKFAVMTTEELEAAQLEAAEEEAIRQEEADRVAQADADKAAGGALQLDVTAFLGDPSAVEAAEKAAAEQLAIEQAAAEQQAAEKVTADRLAAEQAAAEQRAAEEKAKQLAAEQAAAKKAADTAKGKPKARKAK